MMTSRFSRLNIEQRQREKPSMLKRIVGLFGVVLGAVGVALSLAVIMGAWWVNDPITIQLLRVFPPIEMALSFGERTATQFDAFVDDTQTQFNVTADAKPVATALADEIARAAMLVDVASGVVAPTASTIAQFARTDQLASALDRGVKGLASAQILAQQIIDGRTDRIDAINAELAALRVSSVELQTAIEETANAVATIKRRLPRWIDLASLIVTLLFLWFGVAQYSLLRNSWRLLLQRRES